MRHPVNPKRPLDLSAADRVRLMDEIAWASQALKDLQHPEKINVGALGNVVPQLHVHVLGRFKDDPAWPKPVWGLAAPIRFEPADAARETTTWREALSPYGA
jgi:diadenosine tetraphosphate (Ap4A) HIT family hydrolase